MKDHSTARHPGPWRVMQVDSEVAGIIVAVGFLAMGLVSMPIARWFVLGCFALGIVVAVLLLHPETLGGRGSRNPDRARCAPALVGGDAATAPA